MATEQWIAEQINSTIKSKAFGKKAYGIIADSLGSTLQSSYERNYFLKEAYSITTLKVFQAWKNRPEAIEALFTSSRKQNVPYMLTIIQNFCWDQLNDWISADENGVEKIRRRYELDDNESSAVEYLTESHRVASTVEQDAELAKLEQHSSAKGLSELEVKYLTEHFFGNTYVEIAAKYGGTSDKYRKIVKRALEKLS